MKKDMKLSAKNKAFWALSKAEKRVAIAKDIIKSLAKKKILAGRGIYFGSLYQNEVKNRKLDTFIKNNICEVCALGACFFSLVNLGDNIMISEVADKTETYDGKKVINIYNVKDLPFNKIEGHLRKIFSASQRMAIEAAFEKAFISHNYKRVDYALVNSARNFGYKYDNSEERLIAIMENIIANKGTFKP